MNEYLLLLLTGSGLIMQISAQNRIFLLEKKKK